MTENDASRLIARTAFVESLEQAGLRYVDDATYRGTYTAATGPIDFIVTLNEAFPFLPPKVLVDPEESVPWSWHRDRDGSMCLYTDDDHGTTPWLDVSSFLAHLGNWIDNTISGWMADNPDMDLERYFTPSDQPLLILYSDLDRFNAPFVMLRTTAHTAKVIGEGKAPTKHRHRQRLYGYIVDIGTPEEPPRTWDRVMTLAGPNDDVTKLVAEGLIEVVLVRYRRGDTDGVLGLRVHWTAEGVLAHAMPAASDDATVMTMRAGPQRSRLESTHVHIVGGGALGSFIADALVRAGVGRLTIQDHDVVRPGNLVRHLVGREQVGMTKGSAIKHYVDGRTYAHCRIEVSSIAMLTVEQAIEALGSCDLLIDATANSVATNVLAHAARITHTNILAACLQNDGETQRVDVIPPLSGPPIPSTVQRATTHPAMYEGGCGSAVSPTPPHAVIEAAAMTAAHAVGLLIGAPVSPNGELRDRAAL